MLYNAAVSFINNAQQFATEKKYMRERVSAFVLMNDVISSVTVI